MDQVLENIKQSINCTSELIQSEVDRLKRKQRLGTTDRENVSRLVNALSRLVDRYTSLTAGCQAPAGQDTDPGWQNPNL